MLSKGKIVKIVKRSAWSAVKFFVILLTAISLTHLIAKDFSLEFFYEALLYTFLASLAFFPILILIKIFITKKSDDL